MTVETVYYRFVVKRDTAANFTLADTLLLEGEYALELDTGRMKMGDGVTTWAALSYIISGPMDFTGLTDGMVMLWDATAETWRAELPAGGGGSGPAPISITASEALSAGDIVNVWDDAGTPKVRKADATAAGKEASGFVLASVASAATASVYFSGAITGLTGLTPGKVQYLSTTPGIRSEAWVTVVGNVHQEAGIAYSATAMIFVPQSPITLVTPP